MSSRSWSSGIIYFILLCLFVPTGCNQDARENLSLASSGPDIQTLSILPDYALQAMEAAGGVEAWRDVEELQLDGIVSFYQPDGSYYLTEQHFNVYPWSNSIEISGKEPQGSFRWRLSNGQFFVIQGDGKILNSSIAVDNQCFAEALLNALTTPARFLDKSVEFTKEIDPVKIQGEWYYPIERRNEPYIQAYMKLSEAVFYQDWDSSLIDALWLTCQSDGSSVIVRGYEYQTIEAEGISVPSKIEIYLSDSALRQQDRVAQIDFYSVGHSI